MLISLRMKSGHSASMKMFFLPSSQFNAVSRTKNSCKEDFMENRLIVDALINVNKDIFSVLICLIATFYGLQRTKNMASIISFINDDLPYSLQQYQVFQAEFFLVKNRRF